MTPLPRAYYNDNDPFAAQWLRNLIAAGHLPAGAVDERGIEEVTADDVRGFTQCHFFAGIGGWPLALRMSGWPDDRPVWTGSPPCQDYSVAGAVWGVRKGIDGARGRLVRAWLALVEGALPCSLYFENVPGIEKLAVAEIEGRLEGAGYRVARSKLSAADLVGPHTRARVWLAAHRNSAGLEEPRPPGSRAPIENPWRTPPGDVWFAAPGRACGMDDGFPTRVAAVRAYGNAIVPQVAATFVRAVMDAPPP